MAASLVRTCRQFSVIRQSLRDVLRKDHFTNKVLMSLIPTCGQCRSFHNTVASFKKQPYVQGKIKSKKPMVDMWVHITVREIAQILERDVDDVLEALSFIHSNHTYNPNSIILDSSTLTRIANLLGMRVKIILKPTLKNVKDEQDLDAVKRPPPDVSVLVKRHPVVTIMGHIDHGKTTLLDSLRSSSVVETEFGRITQHIGAFNVTLESGEKVTFLDTPGHAAFSLMRARGAHVTDIVVLVVAADDGVMEQTIQSIEMARDANVPIVVAVNKIDKPTADIDRTLTMLAQQGIMVEELGGDVQCVKISALKKTNLNTLTEVLALQAELMELKGDPNGLVEGTVIESTVDTGRGKLATILVQRGTLAKGNVLVSGLAWAKVRALFDHAGNVVAKAGLSEAVQIIGWRDEMPVAGDEVLQVENEKRALAVVRLRQAKQASLLAEEHAKGAAIKHEQHLIVYKQHQLERKLINRYAKKALPVANSDDGTLKVNIVLKGDVHGSVEAILDVFDSYDESDKCQLNIVHYGVGSVTETDLHLADAFDGIVYCFNVAVPRNLQEEAAKKRIEIRHHNVIYKLIDDIKEELCAKLPVQETERVVGEARVLENFKISDGNKKVNVAGCRCVKGVLKKSARFHLVRDGETIYTGGLVSMRHVKSEVESVKTDVECGLRLDDPKVSFEPGDTLICFETEKKRAKVAWDPGF